MVKITITNLNNLEVQSNDNSSTVLSILQENYIDWLHACGGKGRCTTCMLMVESGNENFGELSEGEKKFRNMGKLKPPTERLACQAILLKGSVSIRVPDQSKLPHMNYTD